MRHAAAVPAAERARVSVRFERVVDPASLTAEWRAFEAAAVGHVFASSAVVQAWLTYLAAEERVEPRLVVGRGEHGEMVCLLPFGLRRKGGAGALEWIGGAQADVGSELNGGYYVQPTLFKGHNKMRIFQEEIFGPVLAVTTFKDESEALAIANDTLYGLGAGVWSRNGNVAYRMGRAIKAGRVWTNCYHAYPAHAAFGGYKESGIGRETHKVMLDHYQQTKNLLVSYAEQKLGFF